MLPPDLLEELRRAQAARDEAVSAAPTPRKGIYMNGDTYICPPLEVLFAEDDPDRPSGTRVYLLWQGGDAQEETFLMHLPAPAIADRAGMEALLLPTGWVPAHPAWHDYLVQQSLQAVGQRICAGLRR